MRSQGGMLFKLYLYIVFLLFIVLLPHKVSALECSEKQMKVIYVRGSGQSYDSNEFKTLKSELSKNIPSLSYETLELKKELVDPTDLSEYEAVAVAGSISNIKTGGAAIITAAQFGKYHDSLISGKNILKELLKKYKDDSRCSVLIGYSQGAQVVGETIESLPSDIADNVIYVGLLGDPKLDLDGLGLIPGKNIPWYRGTAIPLLQQGVLGSRKPYLPNKSGHLNILAGSWCFNDDFVCSANYAAALIAHSDAHSEYPERAIPQMALEIANVINNPSGIIDKNKRPAETCGPPKQDIVVLLDTSPMMTRDATIFTDSPMYYGANPPAKMPTAGEMMLKSGCGDTRIAVMGYSTKESGEPQLLLDFTNDHIAYDNLMKSLYEPSSSGAYERTQIREAALKALDLSWREEAGKVLFAITDIAGSGPVGADGWRGWDDQRVTDLYLKDTLSQQLVNKLRETDTILTGSPVLHSYSGYQADPDDNARSYEIDRYLRMIALLSGGYLWNKQVPYYGTYNFKYNLLDQTVNQAIQAREKTIGSVSPIQAKVGDEVTVSLRDTLGLFASATLRGDTVSYKWYVDCANQVKALFDITATVTFTATNVGKCYGSVLVKVSGNGAGCYSCPEPFPPYMYRSFPFMVDIKPKGYTPKIPSQITNLHKVISDTELEYTWDKPANMVGEDVVYVVREMDGNILGATSAERLVVTDTAKTDPLLQIAVVGKEGQSAPVDSTKYVLQIDLRSPDPYVQSNPSVTHAPQNDAGKDDVEESAPTAIAHLVSSGYIPEYLQSNVTTSPVQVSSGKVLAETNQQPISVDNNFSSPLTQGDTVVDQKQVYTRWGSWLSIILVVIFGVGTILKLQRKQKYKK